MSTTARTGLARRAALALLCASGCHCVKQPPTAPAPGDAPNGSTVDTAVAAPAPWLLEPGTTLVGVPTPEGMYTADGYHLGFTWGVLPPSSEGRAVLFVSSKGDILEHFAGLPTTLIFTDPLPRGQHAAVGLHTGDIGAIVDRGVFIPTGDVNGDGHADFWLWEGLYLGPFNRRILWQTEWHAKVDMGIGDVGVGGFDGDGDGEIDVMFAGRFQDGVIHYGPFEGTVPSYYAEDYDPASSTVTAPGCPTEWEYAALLPDLLGAGQHAVAIGVDYGSNCGTDTYIYPLGGPRGRWLSLDSAIATAGTWGSNGLYASAVGDVNGDDVADLLLSSTVSGDVYAGPIRGNALELPLAVAFTGNWTIVRSGMGDVNGDGLGDLLVGVQHDPDGTDLPTDYFLLPSPLTGEIDAREHGIFLANREGLDTLVADWGHADLDGDGREDVLVFTHDSDNGAGAVRIWYASDLFPE